MAIGRVNVANIDAKNLSIFEIDSSIDTTYERSFNVFSQVGTSSTQHRICSGNGIGDNFFMSYGREGNILFLEPIKEGEVWWVVEYDFDKKEFKKQQEVNLGPGEYRGFVKMQNDFNRVEITNGDDEKKTVTVGDIKTSTPKYGAWISDDISVLVRHNTHNDEIIYYKNGNEEMFQIMKDYYFFDGFMFVGDKIAVVTTKEGELQAAKIYSTGKFNKQIKKDTSTLVGWFGGRGYQFIYDAIDDVFLDINIETGRAIERKFVYKSVDW